MLRGRGPAEREYYAPPTLMRARGGKRRVFELLLLALCRLYRVCILTKKELYRWTIPGVGFFLNIFIFLCVCVCICEIIFKNFFFSFISYASTLARCTWFSVRRIFRKSLDT